MSPLTFTLNLGFDPKSRKDGLKAMLHTIFFQRVFGHVRPREHQLEDLTYCLVDDDEVSHIIDSSVGDAIGRLEKNRTEAKVMILVEFNEKKFKKQWFTTVQEEICWERWELLIMQPSNSLSGKSYPLASYIMTVLNLVNSHKEHIPPITSKEKFVFPYKVAVNTVNEGNWADAIKRSVSHDDLLS
ncbi:hypothetical protein DSO57_1019523 [Entomophthora muscae]|uniref:Uncharacterized protein n=1 Tax=Entomophthora muscae TaxID=34485 RepID=A0ACC2UDL0_9FUNG|nr:hypothetical protein DSO57_1019523 [Entomophthora muscae]